MNICIPKERRPFEYRVGLSPAGVEILTRLGHQTYIEHEAGMGGGFADSEYEKAGARIVYSGEEAYGRADLLLKIARPLKEELEWLRPGCAMMGFLHLASARGDKLDVLLEKKVTAIAYEQIRLPDGAHPVLRVFSQMCGAMTAQIAARYLQNNWGGKGILLGGVPGVPPAEVAILGAGTVGTYAAQAFRGLGAHVIVLDSDLTALQKLTDRMPGLSTMIATKRNIERVASFVDVLVGAVLVPGERTPTLVTRETARSMKPRSVIIDIDIDEGGCVETARPTVHDNPAYVEEGVIHYCVPNITGVAGRTATHAFINAAMPFIIEVAQHGAAQAMQRNPAIECAVNTHAGQLLHLHRLIVSKEAEDGSE
ncbi:MAG: Alanine dehydrogenase [Anaerolineales bacterium]|nr:Alanine dehydrogenase [Anaerolineales bacterium]